MATAAMRLEMRSWLHANTVGKHTSTVLKDGVPVGIILSCPVGDFIVADQTGVRRVPHGTLADMKAKWRAEGCWITAA